MAVSPSDNAKKLISAAGEKFLDHDLGAGSPERAIKHHGDRILGFAQGLSDHHALAGGKPVRLDHDRRALGTDMGQRGGDIGEAAIGAGRNAKFRAEILGKSLGALQPRGELARAEGLDAGAREIVNDSGRQRRFRTDHDEIDRVAFAEPDHRVMIGHIERHAFGFPRDAGIARRAPEFRDQRRGCDLPRQRVFAAAGTEQKNMHEVQPDRGLPRDNAHGLARRPPAARTSGRVWICAARRWLQGPICGCG